MNRRKEAALSPTHLSPQPGHNGLVPLQAVTEGATREWVPSQGGSALVGDSPVSCKPMVGRFGGRKPPLRGRDELCLVPLISIRLVKLQVLPNLSFLRSLSGFYHYGVTVHCLRFVNCLSSGRFCAVA